jgi:penicillin-insensitive murein DD-endopeptidase
VELPLQAAGLVSNPNRPNPEARFGTRETIESLLHAAAVVERELPGSHAVINDIGFRDGGVIDHHGSHQAGRDVDVLFYYLDRAGQPWPAKGVPVDPEGRGWDFGDLSDGHDDVSVRLDAARTWRFVQGLLEENSVSPVQRIFLVEHVRTLLLAEAVRVHAPRAIRDRFADVTCQPGYPHDDHLHVRFFCAPDDVREGCEDAGPIYPWRREQLESEGLAPVIARRPLRHSERRGRTGTPPVPPRLHPRVRAFLAQREAWLPQPHPGRPYCR